MFLDPFFTKKKKDIQDINDEPNTTKSKPKLGDYIEYEEVRK
ncbi:MAG: hypothetical protein R2831_08260 [Chitinophagaceae bacterium]